MARVVEEVLGRSIRSFDRLARGTDHDVYEVDGELVARIHVAAGSSSTEAMDRESAILGLMKEISPLPVPEVVALDHERGVMIVRKIPGTSLLDHPAPEPEALAPQLAGFLQSLWGIGHAHLAGLVDKDHVTPDDWATEAAETYRDVADVLSEPQRRLIESFLAAAPPAPAQALAFCHNDLGAEHIFVAPDRHTITGVIDWSDAAIADPAIDFGRLLRDLGPRTIRRIIAETLSITPATATRAQFYARYTLLEDLRYGFATGDSRYSTAALAHLEHTFTVDLS